MKIDDHFFKKIVEHSFLGHLIFDKTTLKCRYANARALEYLGLKDIEFSVLDLASKTLRDGQRTLSRELLQMQGTLDDIFLKKSNGTNTVVQASVFPLSDNDLLFMFQDMTFQKKLQRDLMTKQNEIYLALQELEKQNAELRSLDKAKDRFIALTSHELRTPISAIIATAQFIHDGLADSHEEILQHVDVMLDEGNHLLEMVNDILDFQKIQMGKFELYVEEMDILEPLRHSITSMEKFAQSKSSKLLLEEPPVLPKIFCDPVRIAQVFYNVLSNAIKFSPENSKVIVSVGTKNDFVVISFKDSGTGIPKDQGHKVFNEFETIENIQTHHKGTGLGMPICKRLMESIGGSIYFESTVGHGTTFFVEIPTGRVLEEDQYRKRSSTGDLVA